nr:hypothetical protein [Nocardiopsis sp. NRRL B-16309]
MMAWITPAQGAGRIMAESLREFCEGRLAHHKTPRHVHLVDEFPMTVTDPQGRDARAVGAPPGPRGAGGAGGVRPLRGSRCARRSRRPAR